MISVKEGMLLKECKNAGLIKPRHENFSLIYRTKLQDYEDRENSIGTCCDGNNRFSC